MRGASWYRCAVLTALISTAAQGLEAPRNIVSLAPHITEILYAIGAGEQLVGADEYSDYPAAALELPRVSNYAGANYEQIVALQTDLVIGWESGNGEKMVAPLRQLGIPVVMVEARQLDDIPATVEYLSALVGRPEQGQSVANELRQRLTTLRKRYRDSSPVRYFYQIWDEPLITYNGEHLISAALSECGGVNIFASAKPLVPYVSAEAVLMADPQVMITAGSDREDIASLALWAQWPTLSAVAGDHRYAISADITARHGPRFIDGVEQLCELLDRARR